MAGGTDRFSLAIGADVKHFNGGLFEHASVFRLEREELGQLIAAADADWRTVEHSGRLCEEMERTMAWSGIARREHSREGLRYSSDMTDREWMVTAVHSGREARRSASYN